MDLPLPLLLHSPWILSFWKRVLPKYLQLINHSWTDFPLDPETKHAHKNLAFTGVLSWVKTFSGEGENPSAEPLSIYPFPQNLSFTNHVTGFPCSFHGFWLQFLLLFCLPFPGRAKQYDSVKAVPATSTPPFHVPVGTHKMRRKSPFIIEIL